MYSSPRVDTQEGSGLEGVYGGKKRKVDPLERLASADWANSKG